MLEIFIQVPPCQAAAVRRKRAAGPSIPLERRAARVTAFKHHSGKNDPHLHDKRKDKPFIGPIVEKVFRPRGGRSVRKRK